MQPSDPIERQPSQASPCFIRYRIAVSIGIAIYATLRYRKILGTSYRAVTERGVDYRSTRALESARLKF